MNPVISVVIPCRNCADTIGICLQALAQSDYPYYEIIVVDDCSTDNSRDIIRQFPCTLVSLSRHLGAGRARNAGATKAKGDIIFFTDADCIVCEDTLSKVAKQLNEPQQQGIIGGTYTKAAFDTNFFSRFQSLFIHYSETKSNEPYCSKRKYPDNHKVVKVDYIATHALAISKTVFFRYRGFNNDLYPILEDVEYSHRLKKHGVRLHIAPDIQVRHIFNFNLRRSLGNAFRKSLYWSMYSLQNKDLFKDSGTASLELKINTLVFCLLCATGAVSAIIQSTVLASLAGLLILINLLANRKFLGFLFKEQRSDNALLFSGYYLFIYPCAICLGALCGSLNYLYQLLFAQTNIIFNKE